MREIKYIVLHCTAGPQYQTVKDIVNYWKADVPKGCGWKTPGYHFLISPDGIAHHLVPIEKLSNGVAGHNAHSINISYIGGVEVLKGKNAKGDPINITGKPIDNRTAVQKQTMEVLVRKFHKMFPGAKILGHRDFSEDKNRDGIISPGEWMKACPSFSVNAWLQELGL
ncbi:MAG TPA: N-acetylmuramoyl-L-alanine amidase [Pedobacter sp.]|jgi:N-acetylmuramoyl-L-alanine amidase